MGESTRQIVMWETEQDVDQLKENDWQLQIANGVTKGEGKPVFHTI